MMIADHDICLLTKPDSCKQKKKKSKKNKKQTNKQKIGSSNLSATDLNQIQNEVFGHFIEFGS